MTSDYEEDLVELVCQHMTNSETIREYMRSMTRACYFILLAVGDTGLEDFIDIYFGWLEASYGINGTEFIDRLHRESTLGANTLKETLDSIFDDFFATSMTGMPGNFEITAIEAAIYAFIKDMKESDLSEVAPGFFDFSGFLFDQLLGVTNTKTEFPFRIHRIV
jgi:hypothetical protein